MSDWQVGDLAMCVDASDAGYGFSNLAEGRVYTVEGVDVAGPGWRDAGATGLFLIEAKSPAVSGGYHAARFRKIRPDRHEGEREDWELLLDTVKSPEVVTKIDERRVGL